MSVTTHQVEAACGLELPILNSSTRAPGGGVATSRWLGLIYFGVGLFANLRRPRAAQSGRPDSPDVPLLGSPVPGDDDHGPGRVRGGAPRAAIAASACSIWAWCFRVAGAIGIAATRLWTTLPARPDSLFGFMPAECIWIVLYPLVVPNTPRKVLVASLLAASSGPAVLLLSAGFSGTAIDRPSLFSSLRTTRALSSPTSPAI